MSKIIYGPPEFENLSRGSKSLGEFFINLFHNLNDEPIVTNALTNEVVTASEVLKKSIKLAECLRYNGIKIGDRIGFSSENRIENIFTIFGTYMVGATLVPISSDYGESEMNHMLSLTNPKMIFISQKTAPVVHKVVTDKSYNVEIINYDDNEKVKNFATFLNDTDVPSAGDQFTVEPNNMNETIAAIIWSSGTTGLPKGVEISQSSVLSNIGVSFEGHNGYVLVPSPLSYISGFMTLMGGLGNGGKIVLLPKFEPILYLECVQKFKISGLFFNPALMYMLAKSPIVDKYDLSSIKTIYYGSAPVSPDIVQLVQKRLKDVKIFQFFAMTESCTIAMQDDEHHTMGSLGRLLQGVSGKVVDVQTGELLGPNEQGELLFRNKRQLKGYINNPEATQAAFDKDGYLRTGDIGYYTEKGEWFLVDRIKELIKYAGNTLSPAAIEAVLITHPSVKDICVVGLPDEVALELPIAFVEKQGNVTEKELVDFIAERMSNPHHLRGGVLFVESIPKNSSGSGKSLRRTLKEMAVELKKQQTQ